MAHSLANSIISSAIKQCLIFKASFNVFWIQSDEVDDLTLCTKEKGKPVYWQCEIAGLPTLKKPAYTG